jgi:hypothetical protein
VIAQGHEPVPAPRICEGSGYDGGDHLARGHETEANKRIGRLIRTTPVVDDPVVLLRAVQPALRRTGPPSHLAGGAGGVPGGGTELRSPCGVCIPGTPTRKTVKVVHGRDGIAAVCNSGRLHPAAAQTSSGCRGGEKRRNRAAIGEGARIIDRSLCPGCYRWVIVPS